MAEENAKSVFLSKTLWVNIIAIVGLFSTSKLGFEINGELTAQILAVINLLLRLITKEPVTWS